MNLRHVYHYTSSAHLPHIIASGEHQREGKALLRYPNYLWATACPNGEATASGFGGNWEKTFVSGALVRVRFMLNASDFKPWPQVRAKGKNIPWRQSFDSIDASGRAVGSNPAEWHVRRLPLALRKVVAVHTLAHGETWTPYDIYDPDMCSVDEEFRAIRIGNRAYGAVRFSLPDGRQGCNLMAPIDVAGAEVAA